MAKQQKHRETEKKMARLVFLLPLVFVFFNVMPMLFVVNEAALVAQVSVESLAHTQNNSHHQKTPFNQELLRKPLQAPTQAPIFDYFLLALQWIPSVCLNSPQARRNCKKTQPTIDFQIHGLWPMKIVAPPRSVRLDKPVTKCTTSNIWDPTLIDTALEKSLNDTWPDINGNNKGFWEAEWLKHGTCSGMTMLEYLKEAIDLKDKVNNLRTALKNKGYPPGKSFNPALMSNVLTQTYPGNVPRIVCWKNSRPQRLWEIRFNITVTPSRVLAFNPVVFEPNLCDNSTADFPDQLPR